MTDIDFAPHVTDQFDTAAEKTLTTAFRIEAGGNAFEIPHANFKGVTHEAKNQLGLTPGLPGIGLN